MLLVPQHENEYAPVGTVAEVTDRVRLPGGGRAVSLNGLHRGRRRRGRDRPARAGSSSRSTSARTTRRPPSSRASWSSEYRAVVEEILELRGDDGRIAAFVRSISEPGALADTAGYSPDLTFEQKVELLETVDVDGAPGARPAPAARAARRDAGAPPHPRGRRRGRREAAARVHPAQAARVDPQGARRGRRLGRRGVPHEDRGRGDARRGARAGRARARAASSGWARARPSRR